LIQLYAKLYDVIPTEQKEVKLWEDATVYADPDEVGKWKYQQWLDDFRKNGILKQVRIHPEGHVADGNFRYWGSRDLFLKNQIDNYKWGFLPIDLPFLLGIKKIGDMLTIRSDIIPYMCRYPSIYSKKHVENSSNTWADEDGRCDYSKLGRGTHPHLYHSSLKFFQDTGIKEQRVRFR